VNLSPIRVSFRNSAPTPCKGQVRGPLPQRPGIASPIPAAGVWNFLNSAPATHPSCPPVDVVAALERSEGLGVTSASRAPVPPGGAAGVVCGHPGRCIARHRSRLRCNSPATAAAAGALASAGDRLCAAGRVASAQGHVRQLPNLRQVPHPDGPEPARGEERALGAERHGTDPAGVVLEGGRWGSWRHWRSYQPQAKSRRSSGQAL